MKWPDGSLHSSRLSSWSGLAKCEHIPTSACPVPTWFSEKYSWPEASQGWKRGLTETDGVKVMSAGGISSFSKFWRKKVRLVSSGWQSSRRGLPSCSLPPTFKDFLFALPISLERLAPSGSQLHLISYSHPWARVMTGEPGKGGKGQEREKGCLGGVRERSQIKSCPGSVLSI